jgi:predicted RNA-binding Zn ribbon-like protein
VEFHWLGGRPSLDLVNTRRDRWRGGRETLPEPADLAAWLVGAGLTPTPLRVPQVVLGEARELREAIDAALLAVVGGDRVPATAVAVIDEWLVRAGPRPQLTLGPDGVPLLGERTPADSPRRSLGMVALDAAELLADERQRARLRICAAETCSNRFYDRSPAGARRWCSMTTCGNAAKARRHRARKATA